MQKLVLLYLPRMFVTVSLHHHDRMFDDELSVTVILAVRLLPPQANQCKLTKVLTVLMLVLSFFTNAKRETLSLAGRILSDFITG